ncbi:hypothetical protein STRIC_0492 [Streptococcus ictaluri 707-05]|uniref:Uncharacterized protein n=1 Tax=Streptococcus ictaluri 707-05 TaxID=764299 RepID=G5K605_9STRE|nr:hypothetical protein STRIC_0492 [Streptococcus ictaluri 707-05]
MVFQSMHAATICSFVAVEMVAFLSGDHHIQYLMPQQNWSISSLLWAILAGALITLIAIN